MPVILWDIDGTLIRSGGAGKDAMEGALLEAFNLAVVQGEVPYSGRTDRAIARDLLRVHGIDPSDANQTKLQEAYLARLPGSLSRSEGNVLPGVLQALAELKPRTDVLNGLLTGNIRRGARVKLGHFGLWEHFACGGFGDEHFDRDDVARMAYREVCSHRGCDVDPTDIWVIGDTPLDVRCARAIGAKAVAVATGWHPVEELATCQPDLCFPDLSDFSRLLAAIIRP